QSLFRYRESSFQQEFHHGEFYQLQFGSLPPLQFYPLDTLSEEHCTSHCSVLYWVLIQYHNPFYSKIQQQLRCQCSVLWLLSVSLCFYLLSFIIITSFI